MLNTFPLDPYLLRGQKRKSGGKMEKNVECFPTEIA